MLDLARTCPEDYDVLQMAQAAQKTIIPHEGFAALRQSMEHSDAQREIIIKKSRGTPQVVLGRACLSPRLRSKSSHARVSLGPACAR